MKPFILFICCSILSVVSNASPTEVQHQSGALRSYYERVAQAAAPRADLASMNAVSTFDGKFNCNPTDNHQKTSCVDAMCKPGGFSCNYQSDLQKVVALCRNVDGSCITDVCAQGGFSCNYQSDLTKVAELCKESRGACVKVTCSKGGFSCNYQSDLSKVIELCRNVDESCVDSVCKKGGFSCNYQSDLTKVLEMCRQ